MCLTEGERVDNDTRLVKKVKKSIKDIRFYLEYLDKHIPSENKGNQMIYNLVLQGEPAAVMRLGSTETNCAYPWMVNEKVSNDILQRGLYLSGIFPADEIHNAEFSRIYLEAARSADIMALCDVYKEKAVVDAYCQKASFIKARSIEPYYYAEPWTRGLKNKRVLIVHPFVETIARQYKNRNKIFENQDVLPDFASIQFLKTVQSAAGAKPGFNTWSEALAYMCKEIDKKEFDVAIVGAGAYAMPICAYIKTSGRIAVQMSGATQLLFGIKGKRWDNHPVISKLYNEYWVRPNENETPPKSNKLEGGSYW